MYRNPLSPEQKTWAIVFGVGAVGALGYLIFSEKKPLTSSTALSNTSTAVPPWLAPPQPTAPAARPPSPFVPAPAPATAANPFGHLTIPQVPTQPAPILLKIPPAGPAPTLTPTFDGANIPMGPQLTNGQKTTIRDAIYPAQQHADSALSTWLFDSRNMSDDDYRKDRQDAANWIREGIKVAVNVNNLVRTISSPTADDIDVNLRNASTLNAIPGDPTMENFYGSRSQLLTAINKINSFAA